MREKKGFSRNFLKILAVLTMLIDHMAFLVLEVSGCEEIYEIMRIIGRISFPLFCFVFVQGFLSTHNLRKYMERIFIFAVLSEIPYDLMFSRKLVSLDAQNVLWTFLIAIVALYFMQKFAGNLFAEAIVMVLGSIVAWYFKTDYSYIGVLLIIMLYYLRFNRGYQVISGLLLCLSGGLEIYAVFGLALCYFYSEEKQERQLPKYFFYAFYPAHLLILWGISVFL